MRYSFILLCGFILLGTTACGDDEAGKGTAGAMDAEVPIEDTDSALADDAAPPAIMDAMVPAPEPRSQAAWIELTIDPRRPLYEVGAEIAATAVARDMFGEVVRDAEFTWTVAPPGIAEIDASGLMTTVGEGQGALSACIEDLCGRIPFFVDAASPTLEVRTPARGAMLGGDAVGGIEVTGRAEDSSGHVEVWVNGQRAELAPEGDFSVVVPGTFGVNRISVIADDGVRRPSVEDIRYVLWAPRYLPVAENAGTVEGAVTARVDQAMLDGDDVTEVPDEAAQVTMGDMAELLRFFIELADVGGLLGNPVLVNEENIRLRFDSLSLNTPEVELSFVTGGIELFIRMPDITVVTSGFMDIEGQEVSLSGAIHASLAAYANLEIDVDGNIAVTVDGTGVALESIRGDFESDAVRALLGSFAGILGESVHGGLFQMVERLMREQMPRLIQSALSAVENAIGQVPLQFDPGFGQPISLVLSVAPVAANVRRRTALQMVFDASVTGEGIAPREGDRGIALISEPEPPEGWGQGIGASLRLETLNLLLHEVWRTGAMTLSPAIPEQYQVLVEEVTMDALLPPIIAPASVSNELPLVLQFGALHVAMTPLAGEAPDEYVLSLEVGVGVDADGTNLSLSLSERPTIVSDILEKKSGNPLPSEIFEGIIDTVVWPLVQDVVSRSTALAFDQVALPAEALAEYTPRLQAVTVVPMFDDAREVNAGRLSLEGAIEISVTVGAP